MNLEEEPKMLAYHNDQTIKTNILAQLQAHYDADEIVKGRYWQNGKGCAVGCTVHSDDHADYERLFGIPQALAHLEEEIFEHLPNGDAMGWPLRFMRAIVPGADLSMAGPKFNRWVLHSIALPSAGSDEAVGAAIRGTIAVLDGLIATGTANENAWHAAFDAEYGAAYSAANRAAHAAFDAAFDAAHSAAYSAAHSAEYSAANRAANRAASAAWSAAWSAMADKLIELLETA